MQSDFDDWMQYSHCSHAAYLNEQVGTTYFDTARPHYFAGDPEAKIVLIHLNPKRDRQDFHSQCEYQSFDEYFKFYMNFGRQMYGGDASRTHRSPFDHKQVRFLRPFGVLPFNGEKYHDLEVAIDRKLQLELIPFGSPEFDYKVVGLKNIRPYINRILEAISLFDRKYCIFCGRIFDEILLPYITSRQEYTFRLTKKDGSITKHEYQAIMVTLQCPQTTTPIRACIATQFAKQGCPVERYAEQLASIFSLEKTSSEQNGDDQPATTLRSNP